MMWKNLVIALILFPTLVCAQMQVGSLRVDPPSPNAASLGKYGDIPVSLYTGTPNISVPLYEVKSRTLSLPISLNYHASGIKVEEIASWVGLGWTLNAGGAITRTVRGLPDDNFSVGYLRPGKGADALAAVWSQITPGSQPTTIVTDYLNEVINQQNDPEPDNWFFNFAGRSGRFIMDEISTGKVENVKIIPAQKLSIVGVDSTLFFFNNSVSTIGRWIIKTEDGTTYKFHGVYEKSQNLDAFGSNNQTAHLHVSTWYLTEIVSANGDDKIQLIYENKHDIEHEYLGYQESLLPLDSNPGCPQNSRGPAEITKTTIEARRLKQIVTPTETVYFYSNTLRQDAVKPDGITKQEYQLDSLVVKSNTGERIKKFIFSYDYFNKNATDANEKRLKLLSVTEEGQTGFQNPPHKFNYHDENSGYPALPNRLSAQRDHWGFFNQKTNSLSGSGNGVKLDADLIPEFFAKWDAFSGIPDDYLFLSGADRDPDSTYLYTGTLKEIIYPTGGKTIFEFEPHGFGKIVDQDVAWDLVDATPVTVDALQGQDIFSSPINVQAPAGEKVLVSFNIMLIIDPNIPNNANCSGSVYKRCAAVHLVDGNFIDIPGFLFDNSGLYTRGLDSGTYYLRAVAATDGDGNAASATATWQDKIPAKKRMASGLRIKRVEHHTSDNDPDPDIREYVYDIIPDLPDPDPRSSGVLVDTTQYHFINLPGTGCSYLARSSRSKGALGITNGSHIGYKEVHVLYGEDGVNGKSRYEFWAPDDINKQDVFEQANGQPGELYPGQYYALRNPTSYDWKRGLLKTKADYIAIDPLQGAFAKVSEAAYTYIFDDEITTPLQTNKFKALSVKLGAAGSNASDWFFQRYEVISSWQYRQVETVTIYDPNTSSTPVTTTRTFAYDNPTHLQLTQITDTNSDGGQRITKITYPEDYSTTGNPTGALAAIAELKNRHIHNRIIERTVQENSNYISAELVTFRTDDINNDTKNEAVPDERLVWINDSPTTSFIPATSDGSVFTNDPNYQNQLTFLQYDAYAQLERGQDANSADISHKRSDDKTFLISQCINGNLEEFSFTSFEPGQIDGWNHEEQIIPEYDAQTAAYNTEAHTGKYVARVYTLNGDEFGPTQDFFETQGLNADTGFKASVWVKGPATAYLTININNVSTFKYAFSTNSGDWELLEVELTKAEVLAAMDGNDFIRVFVGNNSTTPAYFDDLRFYPADGLLTTVVWDDETVRVMAVADANNIPIHYRYDSFGRLSEALNADKQLLGYNAYFYSRSASSTDTYDPLDPNFVKTMQIPTDSLSLNFSYSDSPQNHNWSVYKGVASNFSTTYDNTLNSQVMRSTDAALGVVYLGANGVAIDRASPHFWAKMKDTGSASDYLIYIHVWAKDTVNNTSGQYGASPITPRTACPNKRLKTACLRSISTSASNSTTAIGTPSSAIWQPTSSAPVWSSNSSTCAGFRSKACSRLTTST